MNNNTAVLFSTTLCSLGGASISGLDLLRGIKSTWKNTIIVTSSPKSECEGIEENNNIWVEVPRQLAAVGNHPRQLIRKIIGGGLGLLTRLQLLIVFWNKHNVRCAIINGLGSIKLYRRSWLEGATYSILVVRESPAFYNNEEVDFYCKSMNKFDHKIFVSSTVLKKWVKAGMKENNLHYVPNSSDEAKIKDLLKFTKEEVGNNLGLSNGTINFVCPATLQERKGQDIIIRNLKVFKELFQNYKIYFVGAEVGLFKKKLVNIIEKEHLANLIFVGHSDRILEYIYAADAIVFPTRAEAFPRVVIESMALKTVVVASDADGIKEQIADNTSGFIFPVDKPDNFVSALTRYKNCQNKNAILDSANTRYWDEFSRSMQTKRFKEIFGMIELEMAEA